MLNTTTGAMASARSWSWFNTNKNSDADGAYDGNDPAYEDFYHTHSGEDQSSWQPLNPPKAWRELWKARMIDLIDNYQPDLLYFDGAIPFRGDDEFQTGMEVMAHYYNRSIERHGKLDSVMFLKDIDEYMGSFSHGLYVNNVASLDLEQSGAGRLIYRPWQTDFTVVKSGWSYNPTAELYSTDELIRLLVDVVSKYGCLLLNIPPMPSGELEQRVIDRLADIGDWLALNGEAIYGTLPFSVFGQGDDIRYTTKGETLNVILLSWPEGGKLTLDLKDPWRQTAPGVKGVTILADGQPVPFTQNDTDLTINLPADRPAGTTHACVLQVLCDRNPAPDWLI